MHAKRFSLLLLLSILVFTGCTQSNEADQSNHQGAEEKIDGDWHGTINIPGQPLPIQLTFKNEDSLIGAISIPIQGISDYPLSKVKLTDPEIIFTMDIQGDLLTFDGEIHNETMEGSFTQNGQTFPFELEKGELASKEDADDADFLTVETGQGTVYGQLEIPDQTSEDPYPVLIIIPGSGPTDRNGNTLAGENNSLKFLAEQLAAHGIASIRYDKPGAGKNADVTIPEEDMTFDQFVEVAKAWIDLTKDDNRFSNVGIIGHSQGSLEGIMAAQEKNIDAFISLAGAGDSIDKILFNQLKEQLPSKLLTESEEVIQELKEGRTVDKVNPALENVFRPSAQPFLISWMKYTPTEEIKKLTIPILVINGNHDLQIPKQEGELLHQAIDSSELLIIDKMNHVLKEAPEDRDGNLETYANPDLPLADGLIDGIVDFLIKSEFIGK